VSIAVFRHDRHFNAASSFQIGVIPRPTYGVEWKAGARLAALAHDLKPAAVKALRDRRGRLRRPAEAFHLF